MMIFYRKLSVLSGVLKINRQISAQKQLLGTRFTLDQAIYGLTRNFNFDQKSAQEPAATPGMGPTGTSHAPSDWLKGRPNLFVNNL